MPEPIMASSSLYHHRVSASGHPGRIALVLLGCGLTFILIVIPLLTVFYYALRDGLQAYLHHLTHPDSLHSIYLSLFAAAVAVPVNTVFGLAAAWAITKFEFSGKRTLISLIEVPLSISPIVMGVAYLFVYGAQGLFGPWLQEHGIRMVFSVPAILFITTTVTTPFIIRELLPLMQSQGNSEEQAAYSLGASGWQTFLRVTLPNIKWALLCGVFLCFARSLGEFGSVYVVSGAVRGETNTITLQIDLLFHDHNQTASFVVASVLTVFALFTLIIKALIEQREHQALQEGANSLISSSTEVHRPEP